MSKLLNLQNPIPENSNDSVEVKSLFDTYNIVPFFGNDLNTSHRFIDVLEDLTQLSASHKACKNDILTYSFGSIDGLVEYEKDSIISDQEKSKFIDLLANYKLNLSMIQETIESVYDHIKDFGNAYIRIKMIQIKDQKGVYLSIVHPEKIAYLKNKKFEDKLCIITDKWDQEHWKKEAPEILPINLFSDSIINWKDSKEGILNIYETVIHVKQKNDKSDYYGRPDILPVINWMFTEWQVSDTTLKASGTEFVSKYLIFFEEVDPTRVQQSASISNLNNGGLQTSSAIDARMRKVRELTTVEGADPKSIVGMDYPHNHQAPKVEKLDVFRDVAYFESTLKMATSYIFAVWSWSKELTGFSSVNGGIGGNIVFDLFRVKNISTIKPTQKKYQKHFYDLIKVIFDKLEIQEKIYVYQYTDLISQIIQSSNENINNTAGSNQVQ